MACAADAREAAWTTPIRREPRSPPRRTRRPTTRARSSPAADLFVVGEDERIVIPLDPETLADKNAAAQVSRPLRSIAEGIGRNGYTGRWTLSSDGTTMVSVEYPLSLVGFTAERMEIVVRDGLAGPERTRFHPPDLILPDVQVSDDGGRIFAQRTAIDPLRGFPGSIDPPTWYVLDARSGQTLATITASKPEPEHGRRFAWLSPDGGRVYRLEAGGPSSGSEPAPALLLAYDAATGNEIARLDLPDVRAGTWTTERRIEGRPVEEYAVVGHALSPDGTRLALLHDRGRMVTLVDTRRPTIDRVVPLTTVADRGRGTPTAAATPSALQKPGNGELYVEGSASGIAFTADGRGLYVGGQETSVDATGMMSCRQHETRRVDLRTGATVGRTAGIADPWTLASSTDGESVYIIGPNVPNACVVPFTAGSTLRRVDANTLEVLAERELTGLTGHPSIALIPRVPGGR